MLTRKYLIHPYQMTILPAYGSGFDNYRQLLGYQATILDLDGCVAGEGLYGEIFPTEAALKEAWGNRPVSYTKVERDVEWQKWCSSQWAPDGGVGRMPYGN